MDEKETEILRRKLEELDREKQQIISLVSHDIKAPLNRVFALVQLMRLEDSNLTEEQHSYLDKMHLVVADGLGLIRNLVDYRNLEYKRTELLIEKVNLTQVIQLVIKNFQTVAAKKKLVIEQDLKKDIFLHSDHHCVIRIIENILSNAVKFSTEEKTIRVRAGNRNGIVFFSIQDGGPGFTSDDLKKMYKKFQKLSAQPTAGESVTGLGLFIVKTMTEKINGEIVCTTETDLGSTFTVTLPVELSGSE
jgi:signal transduction histidine kinase